MGCASTSLVRRPWSCLVPAMVGTLAVTALTHLTAASTCGPTRVSPEVRRLAAGGPTHVLVELCLASPAGAATPPVEAIAAAQDALLRRLSGIGASVVRRYRTIPWLALEVDASGLAALEAMDDLVVRVSPDSTVRPSKAPSRPAPLSRRDASAAAAG